MYALRHSSIVRMLLKNIPIRLIAALHNTIVGQIERNYSKHITEHTSTISRAPGCCRSRRLPPTTSFRCGERVWASHPQTPMIRAGFR